MDENEVFRELALRVAPSVVVVEDKQNSGLFSGCVIHKTNSDTFVLTHEDMGKVSDLVVHFSDNSAKPAKCIASRPSFAVLAIGEEHKTCNSVLWTDPVIDSDVLILVPKSISSYLKIKGFTSGSCEAAAGDAPPDSVIAESRYFFITSCHHGKTEMMVSTPVFNKGGKGTGVVISDCEHSGDGIPQKICLSGTGLMKMLQVITEEENWQDALSRISDKTKQEQSDDESKKEQSEDKPKKEQRKRRHGQTKTGRKESRHKKVHSARASRFQLTWFPPFIIYRKRRHGQTKTGRKASRHKKVHSAWASRFQFTWFPIETGRKASRHKKVHSA